VYKYTGKPLDTEKGLNLYYFGARYYNPAIGRWLAVDPISCSYPTWSPYAYCLDNPIKYSDINGLWSYAKQYGTTSQGLSKNITNIEGKVDNTFNSVANRDAVVTYAANGRHTPRSLHPSGNAIDLRTRDLTQEQIQQAAKDLQTVLGDDYDVVIESDHIHVEYDPKGNDPKPQPEPQLQPTVTPKSEPQPPQEQPKESEPQSHTKTRPQVKPEQQPKPQQRRPSDLP
jgi:RHS repeat-associated protein